MKSIKQQLRHPRIGTFNEKYKTTAKTSEDWDIQ